MNRNLVSRWLFGVLSLLATSPVTAVTIATVPVGYAGNSPDGLPGNYVGAVTYSYRIGTFDVTNAQYVEYLIAKASAADPYGLWGPAMATSQPEGGIDRTGSGPYTYSVKPGYANKPLVGVSWYEAIRFVNWLSNGQGNGDTESGTYTIANGGRNSGTVLVPDATQRFTWAATNSFHWLLPSENEWFKAAYYNALSSTYYFYPFQSNSTPAELAPPGTANSGNFAQNSSDAWFYPAYNYDGSGSHLTDVGAYPSSLSPFGALDMGGDVYQWNDTMYNSPDSGPFIAVRGGDWASRAGDSGAGFDGFAEPANSGSGVGFRVASVGSVPEPNTGLLAVLACGVMWWKRKVFR